jgi:hypothetical protein
VRTVANVSFQADKHAMVSRLDPLAVAGVPSGAVTRTLAFALALIICVAGMPAALGASEQRPSQLVVLDMELTGDLGGPEFVAEHEARLKLASARLRDNLAATGLYQLIDTAPAKNDLEQLKSQHRYLHDCNGCDLAIGRRLGADQVLVAWVNRVSGLILTLTYEIHDVSTGQIAARKSFDFRGDNDTAWTRAIDYMVRDLKESASAAAR